MYLSKLILNPRNAGARRDVATPYELHRSLVRSLNGYDEKDRLLFRLEPERGDGGPVALVQTAELEPDWSPLLANQYLVQALGPKPVSLDLPAGAHLAFRLVANPTKKQGNKRIALDDEAAYHAWLARKAAQAGFRVLQVAAVPFWINEEHLHDTPRDGYPKQNIPHFGVRFDGVLQVTDAATLQHAVRRGIGPAKAFGFGLLSLARLS